MSLDRNEGISAVVPTFMRPNFLKRALLSVVHQDLSPQEIIVVNDATEDFNDIFKQELISICQNTPLIVTKNCFTKGASGARNYGAKKASGEYLAFLDDDDEWLSTYLSNVSELIKKHDLDLVCTDFLSKNESSPDKPEKSAPDFFRVSDFFFHNAGLRGSNLVIRKNLYFSLGGFNEILPSLNDLDFAIRIAKHRNIKYLPLHKRLVRFNNHDGSRLSTPCSDVKREGVRKFYELYANEMTKNERKHYCQWVRDMWSVNELGEIVGSIKEAADGTSHSRPIT